MHLAIIRLEYCCLEMQFCGYPYLFASIVRRNKHDASTLRVSRCGDASHPALPPSHLSTRHRANFSERASYVISNGSLIDIFAVMSSPQAFLSSPSFSQSSRRKSQFTYKHLHQLSQSSTTCPLRVIALIDLDAFYAQCEQVRLGLPEDTPYDS